MDITDRPVLSVAAISLSFYTHIHTHIHFCICVCVCIFFLIFSPLAIIIWQECAPGIICFRYGSTQPIPSQITFLYLEFYTVRFLLCMYARALVWPMATPSFRSLFARTHNIFFNCKYVPSSSFFPFFYSIQMIKSI